MNEENKNVLRWLIYAYIQAKDKKNIMAQIKIIEAIETFKSMTKEIGAQYEKENKRKS